MNLPDIGDGKIYFGEPSTKPYSVIENRQAQYHSSG